MIEIKTLTRFPATRDGSHYLDYGIHKMDNHDETRYFIKLRDVPNMEFILSKNNKTFYKFDDDFWGPFNRIYLDQIIQVLSPNKEALSWVMFNLDEFR